MAQQPLLDQDPLIIGTSQSHSHTPHLMGPLWMSDQPNKQTSNCTSHNIHKRQTFMPPVRFEPATPANNQPQNHDLDHMVTGIREKPGHTEYQLGVSPI